MAQSIAQVKAARKFGGLKVNLSTYKKNTHIDVEYNPSSWKEFGHYLHLKSEKKLII